MMHMITNVLSRPTFSGSLLKLKDDKYGKWKPVTVRMVYKDFDKEL